jgi:uncharacterized protein
MIVAACANDCSEWPAPPIMEGVLSVFVSRYLPELALLCTIILIQAAGVLFILRGAAAGASLGIRRLIRWGALGSLALECFASLLRYQRVLRHFPLWFSGWGRGLVMAWALFSILLLLAFAIWRLGPRIQPEQSNARRNFLSAAYALVFGAPAATIGYAVFIERFRIGLREQTITVPGLDPDLHGLRLVQLTDIHLSPFLNVRELDRAIAIANETRAHMALVTGDLITSGADPIDLCLSRLAGLRADAGIFGCMGNHEVYGDLEDYVEEHGGRLGLRFLRKTAASLHFGNATLNLAGVDYQRMHKTYLVGMNKLVKNGAFNVLLSHNPDVFRVAARQGYQLTVAGHTHGGQVRVEILRQDLNVARFFTPYVDGLYQQDSSSIFVSRGIGTIGIPARLGSPPEVALLKLCRT